MSRPRAARAPQKSGPYPPPGFGGDEINERLAREEHESVRGLRRALLGMLEQFAYDLGAGKIGSKGNGPRDEEKALAASFRALGLPDPCPESKWPER